MRNNKKIFLKMLILLYKVFLRHLLAKKVMKKVIFFMNILIMFVKEKNSEN